MKADEIMQVLRLTAMGRVNHPDQVAFCERLEGMFAASAPAQELPELAEPPAPAPQPEAKRGKKK